jgi:uncharacterized protein
MTTHGTISKEQKAASFSRKLGIAAIGAVLVVTLVIMKPAAPDTLILLTGPEGSSYHEMGKRLADELHRRGLSTEVRVTDGGFDNLELLAANPDGTVAFAPSNMENVVDDSVNTDDLVSLGSIAWEPFWLFYRAEHEISDIPDLAGLTVSTGPRGTVVDFIGTEMLRANDVLDRVEIPSSDGLTPETVTESLLDGGIDAAFAAGSPAAPIIRDLLANENVSVLSFERAAAYEARFPSIATITIPRGVIDFGRDLPSEDLALLSVTTNLVALDDLYPAAVPLLLEAVARADTRRRLTTETARFPSGENTSLPLDRAASRYYEHGERGLGKVLPYKVTRWLNHVGLVVLPLLVLTMLLIKTVPVGMKIWGRFHLMSMLKVLEFVEKGQAAGADPKELLDKLDELDRRTATIFVPRSTLHDYIDIRQFMHDMRERIAETAGTRAGSSSTDD